jgi:acyl carrier protein
MKLASVDHQKATKRMESYEETERQIVEYLSQVCSTKPELSDSLAMIGIDSVAMAELTFEFEKRFSIRIDDEILDVESVEQLIRYVHDRQLIRK